MKKLARRVSHKMAYLLSALVLLLALAVIVSRFVTPALDTYRPGIEKWAGQLLETPVTIESVSLSWFQYHPVIKLNHITIYDKDSKKPALQMQHIRLLLSLPQSLWQWKPVLAGLVITGSDVKVHESQSGEYVIQGFPAIGGFSKEPFQQESKFADTVTWLSVQPKIILRDIDIYYTGFNRQSRFVTLNDLRLNNARDEHRITGKALLHQDLPTEVSVSVDWQGESYDPDKIKANVYLYVQGISLSQWLNAYEYKGWQLKNGLGSFKIWAKWENGGLNHVQSEFKLYDLALYASASKEIHNINRMLGTVGWQKVEDRQIVSAKDLVIDSPQHLWPVTSLYFAYQFDQQKKLLPLQLKVHYLSLEEIKKFIYAINEFVPKGIIDVLKKLDLEGVVRELDVGFASPWEDYKNNSIKMRFQNISMQPVADIPGFNNLSGNLVWKDDKGKINLSGQRVEIVAADMFNEPLLMDLLEIELALEHTEDNQWQVNLERSQLLNRDVAINLSGGLSLKEKAAPQIDLHGNLTFHKVNRLKYYLPVKLMSTGLSDWLKQAFLSGNIETAKIRLKGPLPSFPFDHNEGIFKVEARIKQTDFRFAPDWPLLKQVNADLVYQDREISINLNHALLDDILINKASGRIPNLGLNEPSVLTVTASDIQADFEKGLHFVFNSPLNEKIGKMFKPMQLSGKLNLNLNLMVPLSFPDKTTVQGGIKIDEARLDLPLWNLKLPDLSGEVFFTEKDLNAEKLEAILFGEPLIFNLATVHRNNNQSYIRVSLLTQLKVSALQGWLKVPIDKVAKGKSSIAGTIDLSMEHPVEVNLHTDLKGIALDLPDQYAKDADTKRDLSIILNIQDKAPLKLKLQYADLLGVAVLLNKKQNEYKPQAINLRLGKGEPVWPKSDGLYITGEMDSLDLDKLKSYASQSSQEGVTGLPFKQLDIKLNKLDLFGIQIHDIDLEVEDKKNQWMISLDSQEVEGLIQLPKKLDKQSTITADFNKITFHSDGRDEHITTDFDLKSLPAFSFTVDRLIYNDMKLGRLSLKTQPFESGQKINSLKLTSPNIDLQSKGVWGVNKTSLSGTVNSDHVSDYLNGLGLPLDNVIAGKGELDFDFSWGGPLYAPSLADISGNISLSLRAGRIIDVGEDTDAKLGIGRMLGLFSLQTIPRRLSLDFSDLFQKGYSFDSLKGDFRLKQGDVYTTNMQFIGPVAVIDIAGRIGLIQRDFDITLSVMPVGMTSTLPVAAAFLAGPAGGVAALALNSMIGSRISHAVSQHYEIKGPWQNPSWTAIQVDSEQTN